MPLIPLVAVVGPTASGKTRLAIDIALKYGGEVVSADSMQIYRGMDIGTAKPSKAEMRGVPHHMLDIADPETPYSVADYVSAAKDCIEDIHKRGRLPVLAGGTGLYINSLVDNIEFGETQRNEALRGALKSQAEEQGGEALLERLRAYDPQTAARLHPNNTGRIIRAIEVYETTGVTMSEMQERSRKTPPLYNLCIIGLGFADRAVLYERINRRVDLMLESGLEAEVSGLLGRLDAGSTAMQAIGYKELAEALAGRVSKGDAIETIKRESRRYAKRQLTWFRRDTRVHWLEANGEYEIICRKAFDIIDNCGLI